MLFQCITHYALTKPYCKM